jgi:predicted  nucleic acid-binding Zn-ribbon protein
MREQIFNDNVKTIIQKKGCTTCGVNQFTDLTEEEFEGNDIYI